MTEKKSYFTDYDPDPKLPHEFTVEERRGQFIGLLDARGNKLYRNPEPVGFVTSFRAEKTHPRRRSKR